MTNLVRAVNEIIDTLPSLEVNGDNKTTSVQHTLNGTTITAKPQGGSSRTGGSSTSSLVIDYPRQWGLALSAAIPPSSGILPSGDFYSLRFSSSTLDEPYSRLSIKEFNLVDDTITTTSFSFLRGSIIGECLSGTNWVYLTGHVSLGGRQTEPTTSGFAIFPTSHPQKPYPMNTGDVWIPLARTTPSAIYFTTGQPYEGQLGPKELDLMMNAYPFAIHGDYEKFKVTDKNRLVDYAGTMFIKNSSYRIPSAEFELSGTQSKTLYLHAAYTPQSGYYGWIDTEAIRPPSQNHPEVFYSTTVGSISATSGIPARITQTLKNDVRFDNLWMR